MATITPLTDEQIDDIRYDINDRAETFKIDARRLERNWQRAEGVWNVFYAWCLRDMTAYYADRVTAEGQDEREYNDSLYKHYKALYDAAAAAAGLDVLQVLHPVTTFNLNQNYPPDDTTDERLYDWEV